ncbi:hypothetical protein HKD37_02G005087 [Glycine soja]
MYSRESLKDFLMRFNGVVIQVTDLNERMVVTTFYKGIWARTFSESLVCCHLDTMMNVHSRVTCHIKAGDLMARK